MTYRLWLQKRRDAKKSIDDADELIDMEGAQFLMWILHVVGNIGRAADEQKKFLTFFLAYKGISRTGRDILSRSGIGMKKTAFDAWKKKKLEEAKVKARCTTK